MAKAARKRKKKEIEGKETEDLSESHKRQKLCPVCGMEMAEERELCAECGRKEMEKERKKKKEKEKGKKKK